MTYGIGKNSSSSNPSVPRPRISSYDAGYEHSLDHCADLKALLLDADKEANDAPVTFAAAS